MRTCASLDGKNAGRIDQARTPYPLRVFLRDDVVGDDADLQIARLHHRDQALDQRRLAGANRTADADAGDTRQLRARHCHLSMYLCASGSLCAGSQVATLPST